jgi:hypothetical protein
MRILLRGEFCACDLLPECSTHPSTPLTPRFPLLELCSFATISMISGAGGE